MQTTPHLFDSSLVVSSVHRRPSRVRAFLFGRTTSYRLNAYDDAAISQSLVAWTRDSVAPDETTVVGQRAARLIADTPPEDRAQRLIVQAYTLFHLNGYADLMYARWIERHTGLHPVRLDSHYLPYETGAVDLWFWLPLVFRRDVSAVHAFAREVAQMALTLTPAEIAGEIIRVQEANIAANHHTRRRLQSEPDGHPKAEMLRSLANDLRHRRIFLHSAGRTQAAAAYWDRVFVWFLRWRYGL